MIVRPFKGLRPREDMVEKVAVRPYDVVTTEEAREVAKKNPYCFYRVTRPEIDFEGDVDPKSDEVIKKAKENLEWLIKEGVMIQDEKPLFYVYKMQKGDHTQIGLIATFSVDEYQQGKIKKHELTRKEKEDERAKHVYILKAHTGPVYLMYKSDEEVNKTFESVVENHSPIYDFTDRAGVIHTVYLVEDENKIKEIKEAFEKVEAFYIADGHHRAAAASRARELFKAENPDHTGEEEYNFFLAVVFPHDRLKVYEYNRVVKDLNGMTKEEFLKKLEEKFTVEKAPKTPYRPEKVHEFGLYFGNGEWYVIRPKEGIFDPNHPVEKLDVQILQKNVLSPLLGIENPRTDPRIDFVPAVNGLGELMEFVDKKGWKVGFALYPTPVEAIIEVSDAGLIMPPKSTWFDPKLKSGIVVHLI